MPFTHHTHSGQFCQHGEDSLEDIVLQAIRLGMDTVVLTEHMPRLLESELYPEEIASSTSPEQLGRTFAAYRAEAVRIRDKYAASLNVLIGFEAEYITPQYGPLVQALQASARQQELPGNSARSIGNNTDDFDVFIGSLHHVCSVPIDFSRELYELARARAGGSDEALFEKYYDEQLAMLRALRPPLVGHLDVVRLWSDSPDLDPSTMSLVWGKILRNLREARSFDAVLEVNSAALRKGLREPYPCGAILREWLAMGGRITISDDAHSVKQVAVQYIGLLAFLRGLGVSSIVVLRVHDSDRVWESVDIDSLGKMVFWEKLERSLGGVSFQLQDELTLQ